MVLRLDSMQSQKQYRKITRVAYERVADEYVKRDLHIILETFEVRAALNSFIKLLQPQASVLDIGSGGGRDSRFLHDYGLTVTGIDFSRTMINQARKIRPRIIYKIMDLEHLKFKPRRFDGVWANASLHHIPKKRLYRVLKQIHTILKPGGVFFAKVKYGKKEGILASVKFGKRITRYFAFYRVHEINKLLSEAGFEIISTHTDKRKEWIDVFAQKP